MKTLSKDISNLMWLCKPYWKHGKLFMVLSLIFLVFPIPFDDILYVAVPGFVVNMLVDGTSIERAVFVVAVIAILGFGRATIPNIFYVYFKKTQTKIDILVRRGVYERAIKTDYQFLDDPDYYNKYTWTLNEYCAQIAKARNFLVRLFGYLLSVAFLVSLIATLGPIILLVQVIQMILRTIINFRMNNNTILYKDEMIPIERRLSYIHRLFYMKDFATDFKTTSLGKVILNNYDTTSVAKTDAEVSYARKTIRLGAVGEAVSMAVEFVVLFIIVRGIIVGDIEQAGTFIVLYLAFYRMDSKIDALVSMLRELNMLSLNTERIKRFFEINSTIENACAGQGLSAPNGNFSVEFKNVDFAYANSDFALSGINIHIRPGEKIAIVGRNGAGKSTLVKLLLRLYDTKEGQILINDVPLQQYDLHSMRQRIGVAFQESNIYAMSLEENVSLYIDKQSAEVEDVFDLLGIDTMLEQGNVDKDVMLTKEFDSAGLVLSGGEIQKIALARVMLRDLGLLLLDEASSALDPIAEHKMNELILSAANKTTTIMIAHRLSSIRRADRIIVFDNGKIIEHGTHSQLMSLDGLYREMFVKQGEGFIEL